MLNDLHNLPDDTTELKGLVGSLANEVKSQALMIEKLKHQLAGARQQRFGASSEALDQLQLKLEEEEVAQAAELSPTEDTEPATLSEAKDKPKRKPLPDNLPRLDHLLSVGDECSDCGGKLKTVGENVTEEL